MTFAPCHYPASALWVLVEATLSTFLRLKIAFSTYGANIRTAAAARTPLLGAAMSGEVYLQAATQALSGGLCVGGWPHHASRHFWWALVPVNRLVQVGELHHDVLVLITNVEHPLVASNDRGHNDLRRATSQVDKHLVL